MVKSTNKVDTDKVNKGKNDTKVSQKRRPGCRFIVACLVVIVAVSVGVFLRERHRRMVEEMEEIFSTHFGDNALQIFKSFDRDGDGYIDIFEFEPIIGRLVEMEENEPFLLEEEEVDPNEEVLTVQSFFKPLLQETMSKRKDLLSMNADSLIGLNNWKVAAKPIEGFPVSKFKAFLPDQVLPVGEAYTVISSNLNMLTTQISSNRFYPPKVKGKEVIVYKLLSMFHEKPFVRSRFGPQGAVALIRAQNAFYVDVVFRIHAEFQLNVPPSNPFWFTPAQFTGNIIMRKDATHVRSFNLYVPTNKSLNVDMEWLNGPSETENMEVDIGFMPQMELNADMASEQITLYDEQGNILNQPDLSQKQPLENIIWDEEVTQEEALKTLEVKLYPFKKVSYFSFEEAFRKAESEKKLVHSLLLWGALDDQSC